MNEVKYEIVRTDDGHHARIKGGNGEIVWTTEVYADVRDAEAAFQFLVDHVYMLDHRIVTANLVDERTITGKSS